MSNQTYDEKLGMNIRNMRMSQGVSQSKLGTAVGITFQQIQKYENGTNRVSVSRCKMIADELGTTIENLLPKDNCKTKVNKVCKMDVAIMREFAKLSDENKEALVNVAKALPSK